MPTGNRREDKFVDLFLSAYENGSWKDADVERPEKTQDNAVEAVATRKSDMQTLAIEHTLIEPFIGEKGDLAQFWPAFEKLQEDKSFFVPDRITRVYVPVGILDGQKASSRQAVVRNIAEWLKANIASLPAARSKPVFRIDIPGKSPLDVVLNIEVIQTPNFSAFRIARQQVSIDLDMVVEKSLRTKLPKLTNTKADRRILMLEREHMNLIGEQIVAEIEKLRPSFPDLAKIDEIWLVETIFYERDDIIYFYQYDRGGKTVSEIGFSKGRILVNWDHTRQGD